MSFLTRIIPRNLTRTTALNARLFTTTSPFSEKTAADTAKETVNSVNKKVGDAAVKGIEKGQQASQTLASSIGIKSKEASGSAKEMTGEAKGKAQEMTGEAKGKAHEVAGEAKAKKEEVKSKM